MNDVTYRGTFSGTIELTDSSVEEEKVEGFETDVELIDPTSQIYNHYAAKGAINDFQICVKKGDYQIYFEICAFLDQNGKIVEGEYEVGTDIAPNRVVIGENSYARYRNENYESFNAYIKSGTVTVTSTDISFEFVVDGGVTVKATASTDGLSFEDAYNFCYPLLPITTLIGSVDEQVQVGDNLPNVYAYRYKDGWHITLNPFYLYGGAGFTLDLVTNMEDFAGTYTDSYSGEQFTFTPGGVNEEIEKYSGAVYQHYAVPYSVDGYAAIVSGTITITKDSDIDESSANYTIVIDGMDANGNSIKVTMPSTKVNVDKTSYLSSPLYEF